LGKCMLTAIACQLTQLTTLIQHSTNMGLTAQSMLFSANHPAHLFNLHQSAHLVPHLHHLGATIQIYQKKLTEYLFNTSVIDMSLEDAPEWLFKHVPNIHSLGTHIALSQKFIQHFNTTGRPRTRHTNLPRDKTALHD